MFKIEKVQVIIYRLLAVKPDFSFKMLLTKPKLLLVSQSMPTPSIQHLNWLWLFQLFKVESSTRTDNRYFLNTQCYFSLGTSLSLHK